MVYVHGGKFSTGDASSHKHPSEYIMDQDVILILMNYRLNILGNNFAIYQCYLNEI